jgi:hypothetical protein
MSKPVSKPDHRHCRVLRAGRQRLRHRAAEQGDELAPFRSISSLAVASNVVESVRRSNRAPYFLLYFDAIC